MNEGTAWRPLVEAFLWPFLFFDTCDDETLDPDTATQRMEDIVAALDGLGDAQKRIVVRILEQIATETEDVRRRKSTRATVELLNENA